jgi:hypothetical protein
MGWPTHDARRRWCTLRVARRYNWYGQLGSEMDVIQYYRIPGDDDVSRSGPAGSNDSMPAVALGPPGSHTVATGLAAGSFHSCAILAPHGRVKCWG